VEAATEQKKLPALSWPPDSTERLRQRMQLMLLCKQKPENAAAIYARCKEDIFFFLENFGWVEYRQGTDTAAIPVVLMPQQKEFIPYFVNVLKEAAESEIFKHNEIIEKARFTAGTWTMLFIIIWFWCFHNASFIVLSKKEDDVDREGDLDTPFEKMRFFLKRLPDFLLPPGFDISKRQWSKTMLLKSPAGGQITGDSSSASATRQKRALMALFDEFAFCENDAAIWSSASGAVKVRCAVSTPNGTNNKYYRLRWGKEGEKVHVTSFTWQRHPVFGRGLRQLPDGRYTSPWYEERRIHDSAQTLARDYDLNYQDSLGATVFFLYGGHHLDPDLRPNRESKLIRIWDPGLTFAVLWAEIDRYDRWLFYKELVMKNAVLDHVAGSVIEITNEIAEGCKVEDIGDPANMYRRASITEDTEYSILQRRYGIYVKTTSISSVSPQKRTMQSIKALLDKMGTKCNELNTPMLMINPKECPILHEAFGGAYAWEVDQQGNIREGYPAQVHPYEDVVDDARYLALHANQGLNSKKPNLHVVKRQGNWSSPRGGRNRDDKDGWISMKGLGPA
jgi:hypothetical protein